MNVGKSIKVGLALSDCKQKELAEFIGASNVSMSNWVNGKSMPGIKTLKCIAAFFGVPLSEFIAWGE